MIGTILNNRYKLIAELGSGGMAWVYLGHDLIEDQRVAIKILYPQLTQDVAFLQRFNQEAKLVMSLSQSLSENRVVRVLDYGADRDTRYLVMEYVEGRDLRRVIGEDGPLPWQTALDVARQIALALDHADRHGIVHRDVKPANIMLLPNGTVRVLDFGIARARTSPTLTHSGFVGSPHYVAPEQAMGRRVDIRADLYSLGVVLYEMLTGERPFRSDTAWAVINQHIAMPPPPLEEIRPDLPTSLARLLRKALGKRREDRFQTPAEMIQAIEVALEGQELATDSRATEPDALAALLDELYLQGQQAVEAESWREAVDLFSQILRLEPRYKDVTEQLAEAGRQARLAALYDAAQRAIRTAFWGDALALLDEIIKFSPDYRDVQALRIRVRQECGETPTHRPTTSSLGTEEWVAALRDLDEGPGQNAQQAPDPAGPRRKPKATVPSQPPPSSPRQPRPKRRRSLTWAVVSLLLLALVLETYFFYQAQQPPAVAAISSTSTDTATVEMVTTTLTATSLPTSSIGQGATPIPQPTYTPVPPTTTPTVTASHTPSQTAPPSPTHTPTPTPTPSQTSTSTATATLAATHGVPQATAYRLTGQIAFPRFDPTRKTYDVYVCRVDGSNCRRVADQASQPDLLPGGSQVVLHSWKPNDKGVVLQTLSGQRIWKIDDRVEVARPCVDFQEDAYTFHSRHEVNHLPYLYRTSGPEVLPLLREANPIQGHSPSWLPDGRILYSGCLGDECGILVMQGDGSYPRQIAAGGSETNPEASPNGKQVVFMSKRDGNWEVYLVNLDGSGLRRLTTNSANDGLPTWSPDGRYIAFVSDRDGSWAVWIMRPNGSQQRRLFGIGGPLDGQVQGSASYEIHGWVEERISWAPLP
jgi:serine/threonine protein kinase